MSEHLLSVKKREGIGRGNSRRLRAQGMIPAVIYGKSGNCNFAVAERDFQMLLREVAGATAVITLNVEENQSIQALIHETQRDPLTDRFRHIDFLEVVAGESIHAHIPVHIVGEPIGVKTGGGLLDLVVHEVEVHCLPRNLPEFIEINVSALNVGDAVHLEDLPVLEGVHFDGEPDMVIVAVASPAKLEAATTTAEPEVEAEAE
ncbi:50S ribosomal protein L25 [Cerasicoccus arenae]|uniref:Large ribosomal subunit protein bL25 n=1 Tax=Cerasicoccus arenae TaxID=424488 RepID=A0A8J3GDX7_9BACT|nr:50S ribosomal protein L25 [Cerasicoccus arenae]MBK1856725.1 50S ribosomal protein L25 [Cerasicoccus arenae]GHB99147.1 50S ribosomal protein L25 [Cerasicoccus arenae]